MATLIRATPHASAPESLPPRRRLTAWLSDPRRALLAAILILTAGVGLDALSDPDVWWHIRLGDWIIEHHQIPAGELFAYTAFGNPLVAHEWLSETIFAALAAAGGLLLVTMVMGLVAWSALGATVLRGHLRGAGPVVLAIGLALGARVAEPVLGTRPQVFTFALICWTLWIADTYLRSGGRRIWLLPPLFLLWANLHAGFIAGVGLLVMVVAAEAVKRRWSIGTVAPRRRITGLGMAVGASALAACLNPYGPWLYVFAATTGGTERQKGIIEWQSPNFGDPAMWALLALLLTFAALTVTVLARPSLRHHFDLRDFVLAAVGAGLALTSVRNTAICVAVMVPPWMAMSAVVVRSLGARHAPQDGAGRAAPIMGVALIAVGVLGVGVVGTRVAQSASSQGIEAAYPACATALLARSPATQRVFTAYGTGGYVIYRLWPRASVYEYGESISLGTSVFDDYVRIAAGVTTAPTALALLASSDTTAVLSSKGALTGELDATPGWTRVTDDHGMLLYVRGEASWASGATCSAAAPG
ncbi:MAG TPA: hypothetical protein VND54_00545 [Candidatus Saccharimonadales bacterium]|nr:hypothetical protein [Candidatus Saccharimonadales bacterium]